MSTGLLIAFEGIDGTGKSTQLRLLAAYLQQQGYTVVATREPTDGPYGRQIRALYHNRRQVSPERELELFLLDRQQHVDLCIQPALTRGDIVLTDRYFFSTAAYQGAAGCDPEAIFRRHGFAPEPDMVLLLTLTAAESVARIRELRGEGLNDFEQQEQLEKVATLFASFAHKCIVRINAAQPVEAVQDSIRKTVLQLIRRKRKGCTG
ncbi:dTMP kinase [Desulfobulbus alkaliphilus]|uniref:dTMP kinase n=1 Tax=Desulfobulbus alkaliphilus TaxID=869814 RepID=UPI0019652B11|nr:dTMP kinase [Desulfobulbus alkaliphilus]MBM9536421.1 dTMP kinase [Desulfobulbus alkaliphilus]